MYVILPGTTTVLCIPIIVISTTGHRANSLSALDRQMQRGVLLYAVIIGSLSSALHSSDAAGARRRQKMDSVNDFLRSHNIPMSLQRRIRAFYDFSFSSQQDAGDHGMLDDLPSALKMRLMVSMNHRRIRTIPIFNSCPDECVLAIIERLKGSLSVPGEYVVNSGQWGTNLGAS